MKEVRGKGVWTEGEGRVRVRGERREESVKEGRWERSEQGE